MRLLVFIVITLLPSFTAAQSLTEEGSIVNLKGDTLRGQITIRRSSQNPRFIDFTPQGATATRYFPNEIKSFYLDDDTRYIGVITIVDKSPSKIADFAEFLGDQKAVRDTVFLFLVVSGKLDFYRLVDERDKVHYYVGEDEIFTELTRVVQRQEVNGEIKLVIFDEYKNQLRSLITNCSAASARIGRTPYYQKELSEIIVEYNRCNPGSDAVKVQKEEKARVVFSVTSGVVFPKADFTVPENFGPYLSVFTSPPGFTAGGVLEIVAQRRLPGFSLVNELVVYGFNFTSEVTPGIPNALGGPFYMDYTYLRYNLGARYSFNRTGAVKPFVQAGFGAGYAYKRSYNFGIFINKKGEGIQVTNDEYAMHGAIGVKYRRLTVQGRLDRATGPSESVGFITRVNNWQLLLSFDLTKPK